MHVAVSRCAVCLGTGEVLLVAPPAYDEVCIDPIFDMSASAQEAIARHEERVAHFWLGTQEVNDEGNEEDSLSPAGPE